jgi:hypothetical protein
MKALHSFFWAFIFTFFWSCESEPDSDKEDHNIGSIKERVLKWNDALINGDLETLPVLYADSVLYYGQQKTKIELIKSKEAFFKKYTDFTQSIIGDINIQKTNDGSYKVSFQKITTFGMKSDTLEGRLIFNEFSHVWKITSESDDKTDMRLSKKDSEYQSCLDVVLKIVTTSPLFLKKTNGLEQAVIKNGGTGYGISLESSPDPESDDAFEFSETYDFNLHETYPDRITVIARFSFNPKTSELYDYDEINDVYTPVEFDKSLLKYMNDWCN